ncbi:hypothetical protein LOTGIDRAFT_103673 [Lottia gigantea]|uniref:Mitochondrial inner membrane protease subunit n=1 Tax=Lottia gigantea TaxID=225164 RepID=V4AUQ0_LOTGI|nr:hypothetical protein LOTGIDRAFT_103673 [Lottia gigantea]ESO97521.1 hypothetical protein LOTGIDRAFT_103673 [Lottia gigantea]
MIKRFFAKTSGVVFYSVSFASVFHCFFEHIASLIVADGPSMQPTIYTDDILLSEQISVKNEKIIKGDVVLVKSPTDPLGIIIKRVIGMEGDMVFNYSSQSFKYVPRGHVWLEGDNKSNSTDSREYGPVPYNLLHGRIFLKVWPIGDVGFLGLRD